MSWLNKSILVTGATGFIGGRVCERLIQSGAPKVRALVHNMGHAARISRLPIELCSGDLLDRRSLGRALADTRIVIHLGLGYGPAIVRGTRNLLKVAEAARVERFIHMSTTGVYGLKASPGCENEERPLRRTGNVYCDNKLRAEQIVERFARRGLPVVILRPSIVYGPYSRWCTRLVEGLRAGTVALIDGGEGICNTTYVDNLVHAIFLAVENEQAVGQAFFITDGERVTWGDFVQAHAAMMDPQPGLPKLSTEQILAHYREQPGIWVRSLKELRKVLVSREFREMVKRIPLCERVIQRLWYSLHNLDEERRMRLRVRLAGRPNLLPTARNGLPIPDLDTWAVQTGTVVFQIAKARKILGYEPRVPFRRGILLTEQWLRFANYL